MSSIRSKLSFLHWEDIRRILEIEKEVVQQSYAVSGHRVILKLHNHPTSGERSYELNYLIIKLIIPNTYERIRIHRIFILIGTLYDDKNNYMLDINFIHMNKQLISKFRSKNLETRWNVRLSTGRLGDYILKRTSMTDRVPGQKEESQGNGVRSGQSLLRQPPSFR